MKAIGNLSALVGIVFMMLSFVNAFQMFKEFTIWKVFELVFCIVMWLLFVGLSQKLLNPKKVQNNCKNCDRDFDNCIC